MTSEDPGGVIDSQTSGPVFLIVDDDPMVRMIVTRGLTQLSPSEVIEVEDGLEAQAVLQRKAVDVVVTDVVMPNMDGFELYTAIQERRPDLPVLMMTAFHYDKDHIIKRSRMAGLETVIFKKPVDPDRLLSLIHI